MINFETSEVEIGLQLAKMMNPKVNYDLSYTFYHDETNKKNLCKRG